MRKLIVRAHILLAVILMKNDGRLTDLVKSYEREMVRALSDMIAVPAISPESGGEGEYDRAEFLSSLLKENGMDRIEWCDAPDRKAKKGRRPNLIATVGRGKPSLWVISHMDTVPEGDRALWKTDPFKAVVKGGKIYGRGAEDNGQSLIASLFAARAALESGQPGSLKLAFVSDEELGSAKGITYVASKGKFTKGDEFLVPDAGSSLGNEIEIAEKHSLWARVDTEGKQTHASTPDTGINASVAASRFLVFIRDYLYSEYNASDDLFQPVPRSTFEPTKRIANVENVNTIPGTDEFYIDSRILPSYNLDSILADMRNVASVFSRMTGARISVDAYRKNVAAKPTSPESSISVKIANAIREMRGLEPKFIGIGGGTCANIVRARGYQAAVWSTEDGMAHQPNEYSIIKNMVSDSAVMASLFTS